MANENLETLNAKNNSWNKSDNVHLFIENAAQL